MVKRALFRVLKRIFFQKRLINILLKTDFLDRAQDRKSYQVTYLSFLTTTGHLSLYFQKHFFSSYLPQ